MIDKNQHVTAPKQQPKPLAVSAEQAALMLSISTRKLWELSNRGIVPSLRIGRRRLYRPADLESWLQEQIEASGN